MSVDSPQAERLRRLAEADPLLAWSGEDAVPWGDLVFGERVLATHLDPATPAATRPPAVVTHHVDWLARLLPAPGSSILDVCCGPGLYCHELARRGHQCLGLDINDAALQWAGACSDTERLPCAFITVDLMQPLEYDVTSSGPYQAVTCWFGDFHAFPMPVARGLLGQLADLLAPGGCLVLEMQPWDDWEREDGLTIEESGPTFFCPAPHLWLQRHRWDQATHTEVHGHWLLEKESGRMTRYVQCHQAWAPDELAALLAGAGLGRPEWHDPIAGVEDGFEFPVLVAWREG